MRKQITSERHFHLFRPLKQLLTTREAQAAAVSVGMTVLLVHVHLYLLLVHAALVVVVVLQVPDGWPAIFAQIFLVFRVQLLQRLW
jgi:hypothetical protein